MVTRFTVSIVGNKGVGKSTFLGQCMGGQFKKNDNTGIDLDFSTNYGEIKFLVKYYSGGQTDTNIKFISSGIKQDSGFIVMFDMTDDQSRNDVQFWTGIIREKHANAPIVVCGNKLDIFYHDINNNIINPSIYISSKSGIGVHVPFLDLARKLLGYNDLQFREPKISLPTINSPQSSLSVPEIVTNLNDSKHTLTIPVPKFDSSQKQVYFTSTKDGLIRITCELYPHGQVIEQ